MATVPQQTETLEQRVTRLLNQWRQETLYLSSTTEILRHPAYQEIIALGPAVLPLLFRDLERTQDGFLSRALTALTGADPVPEEDSGKVRKIADAWLRWARGNGHQW